MPRSSGSGAAPGWLVKINQLKSDTEFIQKSKVKVL